MCLFILNYKAYSLSLKSWLEPNVYSLTNSQPKNLMAFSISDQNETWRTKQLLQLCLLITCSFLYQEYSKPRCLQITSYFPTQWQVTTVTCKVKTVILCISKWAVRIVREACLKNGVTSHPRFYSLCSHVNWSGLFSPCWSKRHERSNGNRLGGLVKLFVCVASGNLSSCQMIIIYIV
jgi:hypothetical protein